MAPNLNDKNKADDYINQVPIFNRQFRLQKACSVHVTYMIVIGSLHECL